MRGDNLLRLCIVISKYERPREKTRGEEKRGEEEGESDGWLTIEIYQ